MCQVHLTLILIPIFLLYFKYILSKIIVHSDQEMKSSVFQSYAMNVYETILISSGIMQCQHSNGSTIMNSIVCSFVSVYLISKTVHLLGSVSKIYIYFHKYLQYLPKDGIFVIQAAYYYTRSNPCTMYSSFNQYEILNTKLIRMKI